MALASRNTGTYDRLEVRGPLFMRTAANAPYTSGYVLTADGRGGTYFSDPTLIGTPLTDTESWVVLPQARLTDDQPAIPSSLVRVMTIASPDTGGIAPAFYREATGAASTSGVLPGWQNATIEHVNAFGWMPILSTSGATAVGFTPIVEQRETVVLVSSPSALLGATVVTAYSTYARAFLDEVATPLGPDQSAPGGLLIATGNGGMTVGFSRENGMQVGVSDASGGPTWSVGDAASGALLLSFAPYGAPGNPCAGGLLSVATVLADVVEGNVFTTSDARLKTAVVPVERALSTLRALRPVYYEWAPVGATAPVQPPTDNAVPLQPQLQPDVQPQPQPQQPQPQPQQQQQRQTMVPGLPELGFLAQNVRAAVPNIVRERADGTLTLCYERLTALLTGAVQEQAVTIDALNVAQAQHASSVAALEGEVAALRRAVQRLGDVATAATGAPPALSPNATWVDRSSSGSTTMRRPVSSLWLDTVWAPTPDEAHALQDTCLSRALQECLAR